MKYVPVVLAGLFSFLFGIFALIPSIKFTKAQRRKYPLLTFPDGKQVIFAICAVLCALFAAFSGIWKDYIAMQPQTEVVQENSNLNKVTNEAQKENRVSNANSENLDRIINHASNSAETIESNKSQQETNPSQQNIDSRSRKLVPSKQKDNLQINTKKESIGAINTQSLSKVRSLISQAKYNEAINECDKILRINPNNSEAASLKNWARKQLEILNK